MDLNFVVETIKNEARLIIPGFGAFLHKESTENGKVSITFSPFLKYNDGKFEELIVKQFGISKLEANKKIEEFIISVKEEIAKKSYLELSGIGYLVQDKKGSIYLSDKISNKTNETNNVENSTKQNHDIVSSDTSEKEDAKEQNRLQSEDINSDTPNDKIDENAMEFIDETPDSEEECATNSANGNNQPDMSKENLTTKNKKHVGKRITIIASFVVISICVAVLAAYIIRVLVNTPSIDTSDDNFLENSKVSLSADSSSSTNIDMPSNFKQATDSIESQGKPTKVEETSKNISAEDLIEKELKAPNKQVNSEIKKYHLIVGSFSNQVNANNLVKKLERQGYKAYVIKRKNNLFSVSIAALSSREQAEREKARYSSNFKGIWIMQK